MPHVLILFTRNMKVQKLTRRQIKDYLEKVPITHVLGIENRQLTHKQKKFAYELAIGQTKAQAYRNAYKEGKANMNKKRDGNAGHALSQHEGIAREVEAIKAGIEFQRLYSEAQLKALVVAQLTKEALNPENQGATRVNALKTLGTVAGVDAFVHRSETKVIKESADIKQELLDKLREALADSERTIDADAEELLREIEGGYAIEADAAGGPPRGDPPNVSIAQAELQHSNPHTQSPKNSGQAQQGVAGDVATLPDEPTPSVGKKQQGEGV